MKIKEKDLYKYVFYKEELSIEKKKFIDANTNKFSETLNLLNEIKSGYKEEISPFIADKINNLIEQNYDDKVVTLSLLEDQVQTEYLLLAADSENSNTNPQVQTFIDNKKEYLIKINNSDEEIGKRIFFFSKNENEKLNFELTLLPSKDKLKITSLKSQSFKINNQHIEKIELREGI